MTKVSRKEIQVEDYNRMERELWSLIANFRTARDVQEFFFDVLTLTERKMITKRLQIACMLAQKESYGRIKKRLKVTDSTIAKINNWLNSFGEGYRKAFRYLGITKHKFN